MVKFLNLLTDELKRASKFFVSVAVILVISQLIIVSYNARIIGYSHLIGVVLLKDLYGASDWIGVLVGASIIVFVAYAIYTWVSEWSREEKFAYRLLTLPGGRVQIAYAKLFSIIIMLTCMLIIQIGVFHLVDFLAKDLVENYVSYPWQYYLKSNDAIIPFGVENVLSTCAVVVSALVSLFNLMILIVSRRSHGISKTVALVLAVVFVHILTSYLSVYIPYEHIGSESTALLVFMGINMLQLALNLGIMHYLMNNYISI